MSNWFPGGSGGCRPPSGTVSISHRFRIPIGRVVEVCRVEGGSEYQKHRTRVELAFDRYEWRDGSWYRFRYEGWWILVHRGKMVVEERYAERRWKRKR